MDDDDIQAKDIEEKLKSQLRQLEVEHAVFERMVYKNKSISNGRRDLRLLRTANMEEILRPCFHVISGTETSCFEEGLCSLKLNKSDTGKPKLLDRLRGALHLLSQMTEPILKAARCIRTWDIHSAGLFIFLRIFCDIFGAAFTSPSVVSKKDTSPSPLLEGDENVGVTASESSTPLAEAASSKTNNG
uniref:Uncharacterized protein n=1 Tax=Brassica campestris TaxID=3711 RepID=M4ENU7_BRACM